MRPFNQRSPALSIPFNPPSLKKFGPPSIYFLDTPEASLYMVMRMNLRKKLLLDDISEMGKILSGREKGEEVVRHMKSRLPLLTEDGFLVLNMDRVEPIDYPAADEMVNGAFHGRLGPLLKILRIYGAIANLSG
jgi:hypothetical protein